MGTIIVITLFVTVLLFFSFAGKKGRIRQRKNIKTADKVIKQLSCFSGENKEARILSYLRKIDPFVFEELLLTSFEKLGYIIERNDRYTGDGGIDGRVYLNGKLYLIQAKRYKSYVNTKHLSDFLQLVNQTEQAEGGYFIHTGKTGKETYQLYKNSRIEIISGDKLINLIIQQNHGYKKSSNRT